MHLCVCVSAHAHVRACAHLHLQASAALSAAGVQRPASPSMPPLRQLLGHAREGLGPPLVKFSAWGRFGNNIFSLSC